MAKLNPWKIQGYKPGQNVICKIIKPEPGGYAVIIPKDNLPGFLPSDVRHNIGEEVLAQYVCLDKDRMLLSERFTAGAKGQAQENAAPKTEKVNWLEQLEQNESYYDSLPGSAPSADASQQQDPSASMTDAEQAFQVYAQGVPTQRFQLRRAIDLIMPPLDESSMTSLRIGDYDVEWLITDLEGGMRTGCVKCACESKLSRSAMLLYKGRAVGCIYGSKSDPNTKPTEESLSHLLRDLDSPDTVVTLYDLPENITMAMSSLFLGYPVETKEDYEAAEYLNYICDWLTSEQVTATLAITLSDGKGTCLGYVFRGQYVGSFYVEDQQFHPDRDFIDTLIQGDPRAQLEVSILPPEMHSSAVRFGFSLSMARSRNNSY